MEIPLQIPLLRGGLQKEKTLYTHSGLSRFSQPTTGNMERVKAWIIREFSHEFSHEDALKPVKNPPEFEESEP